jgi:heme oxygenase
MHPVMESRLNAPLAERLKNETRALHTAAERSAFMSALLGGRLDRSAYCTLLRNLHAIYAVLESSLERHAAHPMIKPIYLPALWRRHALEQDLKSLCGASWQNSLPVKPATVAYVDRLREIEVSEPGCLLAHAYVRYLGDLSGGQMLRDVVATRMSWSGSDAVAFYDFGDPPTTRELTRAFREGLAQVRVDDARADDLVAEAKRSFELHRRLFVELADVDDVAGQQAKTVLSQATKLA